jgi:hypothetical protein
MKNNWMVEPLELKHNTTLNCIELEEKKNENGNSTDEWDYGSEDMTLDLSDSK